MKAVVDTSVLIGPAIQPLEGDLAVSAATLAELHYGVLAASDEAARAQRLRRLSLVEINLEPLPVDEAVARSYGLLASKVAKAGRQPRTRVMDLLIAATAHANGAALYTANADDLHGLEDEVEILSVDLHR